MFRLPRKAIILTDVMVRILLSINIGDTLFLVPLLIHNLICPALKLAIYESTATWLPSPCLILPRPFVTFRIG